MYLPYLNLQEVVPIGEEEGTVFGAYFPALLKPLCGELDFVAAKLFVQRIDSREWLRDLHIGLH